MGNRTITEFIADTSITGTEEIPVWDAGISKKITINELAAHTGHYSLVANEAALPVTGEDYILYVTADKGLFFRWETSAYVQIIPSEYNGIKYVTAPVNVQTTEGNTYWNSSDHCLDTYTGLGGVVVQNGQELLLLVYVPANASEAIVDGWPISLDGSSGQRPIGYRTDVTSESSCRCFMGIATMSIPKGTHGFVNMKGLVRGINTNAFNEGDRLWVTAVSPYLSNVEPTSGQRVLAGMVLTKSGTGTIFSSPRHFELTAEKKSYLENITIDTREPTGFLDTQNDNLEYAPISVVHNVGPGTLTCTVQLNSGDLVYWWRGERKTIASISATATKAEGIFYLYTTDGTNFQLSQDAFNILTDMMVAEFYWDNTNNAVLWSQPEWHGLTMDGRTHYHLHEAFGTRFVSGLDITYSTGTAVTRIKLTNGEIHDEDISAYINHSTTPTAVWEQILGEAGTATTSYANLPIYYLSGTVPPGKTYPLRRKLAATSYPFAPTTDTLMYYNQNNAGTWNYTTSVSTGRYVVMWVVGTTHSTEPIILIPGIQNNANLTAAQAEAFPSLTEFLTEYKLLYRLIYQSNTGTTGPGKANLISVTDVRRDAFSNNAASAPTPSAALVSYSPTGNLAATNVQDAIDELDTEKLAADGGVISNYKEELYTATTGGNITIDLANGMVQRFILDAAREFTMPADPGSFGRSFVLILECATYTPTWAASPVIEWLTSDGAAPTLVTTANLVNVLTFIWDDVDSRWLGFLAGKETA